MHFQLILRSGPALGSAPAAVPQLCSCCDPSSFGPWLLMSCICVSGVQMMNPSDVSFVNISWSRGAFTTHEQLSAFCLHSISLGQYQLNNKCLGVTVWKQLLIFPFPGLSRAALQGNNVYYGLCSVSSLALSKHARGLGWTRPSLPFPQATSQ